MDTEQLSKFIIPIGTISAVILGWILNSFSHSFSKRYERKQLIKYSEKLVRELCHIIAKNFSDEESIYNNLGPPRRVFPKHIKKEFLELHKTSRELDWEISIYLMWLNQSIANLESNIHNFNDLLTNPEKEKRIEKEQEEYVSDVIMSSEKVREYCYYVWFLCLNKKNLLSYMRANYSSDYLILKNEFDEYNLKSNYDIEHI